MNRRREKNNKGFSLMELIALIALMGIISVGAIGSYGLIFGTSAKTAAGNLEYAMNKTKSEAMSRASASMELYRSSEDSKYYVTYYVNGVPGETINVGNSRVTISYVDSKAEPQTHQITGAEKLTISYQRDTGAFRPVFSDEDGEVYCRRIILQSGRKTYTLTCERLTGKVIFE